MHFDLQNAVAAARLATPALDVEGEAAVAIAAHLRIRRGGEHLADEVEQAGIRRRIAARRPADGALIDVDDLVERVDALDPVAIARPRARPIEVAQQRLFDQFVDQAGLAAAGYARDAHEHAERNGHVDVFQVVGARAAYHERAPVARPPLCRRVDALAAGKVRAGDGVRGGGDLFRRALGDHMAAVRAGARADVHDVIRLADGLLVVLDDDERIAEVAHLLERAEQARIVPLVQADARLVEDVQHAHEPAADLRGQPDALRLAAGKGGGGARERQVIEPHVDEKAQPGVNLLEDLPGDHAMHGRKLQPLQKRARIAHGHIRKLRDVLPADRHGQDLFLKPLAVAGGAGRFRHERLHLLLAVIGLRFAVAALHVRDDALKRGVKRAAAELLLILDMELFLPGAIQRRMLQRLWQLPKRRVHRRAVAIAQRRKVHGRDGAGVAAVPAGNVDRPARKRQLRVRYDERRVDLEQRAKA